MKRVFFFAKFATWPEINKTGEPHRHNLQPKWLLAFFYRELKMSRKGEDRAANSSEKHERTLMVRLVSASRATKYAKHPAAGLAFRLEEHFTDPSAALIATRLPCWPASKPRHVHPAALMPRGQRSALIPSVPHV